MHPEHELIIVFKKNVTEAQAEKLLQSFHVTFREGMDSSKGKIYYYATGPKFIITFDNAAQREEFGRKRYYFLPEVHQIYEPDWDIQKD